MTKYNIKEDFIKGWFIGDFNKAIQRTTDFEVAIKHYKAGDEEDNHVHLKADEYTVVVSGTIQMNGELYHADDVILIEKGEAVKFKAIDDAVNVVVKTPSVMGDKYVQVK